MSLLEVELCKDARKATVVDYYIKEMGIRSSDVILYILRSVDFDSHQ